MNDLLESNRELRQASANASATPAEVRRTAAAVARLGAEDRAYGTTPSAPGRWPAKTTRRTEDLAASVDRLVNDPRLRDPLAKTAASVARLAQTAEGSAAGQLNGPRVSRPTPRPRARAERYRQGHRADCRQRREDHRRIGWPSEEARRRARTGGGGRGSGSDIAGAGELLLPPHANGGTGVSPTGGLEAEADLLYETNQGTSARI